MSLPHDENLDYPQEKGRRLMARFALRRMSKLAAASRDEDRRNARFARRMLLAIGVCLATLAVGLPLLWRLLPAHSRGELAVLSVVIGLIAGLAAAIWPRRRG